MPAPIRGASFGLALLVTASVALTSPATATVVWTVDPSGAGDFTTIQAALDSAFVVFYEPTERPDSILVAPGDYDEVVYNTLFDAPRTVLRAVAGPTMTTVRKFCHAGCPPRMTKLSEGGASPGPWGLLVSGFSIRDSLWVAGPSATLVFEECVFLDHVRMSDASSSRFFGCEFRGGADFNDTYLAAEDCRFVGSRVFVAVADHWTRFIGCSFEGPIDTAIVHRGGDIDALRLISCTFKNVDVAVGSDRWRASQRGGVWAQACRFEDISNVAFTWDYVGEEYPSHTSPLVISDSYFLRCSRVIDWGGYHPAAIALLRDTLESCGPVSIRAAVFAGVNSEIPPLGDPKILGLVAIGQQGRLFDISLRSHLPQSASRTSHTKLWLTGLKVEGGGDTLGVVRTVDAKLFTTEVEATDNQFRGSAGPGLWISASRVVASGNTFAQVGGHALEIPARPDTTEVFLHHNTIIGSGGDGFRVPAAGDVFVLASIHHNLFVQNAGDGLHIGAPYDGSIASNDSWLNYGAAYFGGGSLDSNLTVDPIFCDVVAGDLRVSSVSLCRPAGPYGQIGAHGEGCTRLADAGPQVEGRASVWPNPARDVVSFSLHGHVGRWGAEVFDVGGRRVWRSSPDTEGAIRWNGLTDSGAKVGAGLYWVRFRSAGQADRVARLVWLQ